MGILNSAENFRKQPALYRQALEGTVQAGTFVQRSHSPLHSGTIVPTRHTHCPRSGTAPCSGAPSKHGLCLRAVVVPVAPISTYNTQTGWSQSWGFTELRLIATRELDWTLFETCSIGDVGLLGHARAGEFKALRVSVPVLVVNGQRVTKGWEKRSWIGKEWKGGVSVQYLSRIYINESARALFQRVSCFQETGLRDGGTVVVLLELSSWDIFL